MALETLDPAEARREIPLLTTGLDYYKLTMSQLAFEQEPEAVVTFTFHNRGEQRLLDYINPDALQARFDAMRGAGWSSGEIDYLRTLTDSTGDRVFREPFLEHLAKSTLPAVNVAYVPEIDDIRPIVAEDLDPAERWSLSMFWETVVMSQITETYAEGYMRAHGLDPAQVWEEGDRRLSEKIAILRERPDIKFSDFGTRRRFSLDWQDHVIARLRAECPDNFLGTSNVALSAKYGTKPIGTFAHELFMVYAALADARGEDIRASHNRVPRDWYNRYGVDLSTALTDTFGSEFFFRDFTAEQAAAWKGLRQDSGDEVAFGERALRFYREYGVDTRDKQIVFSNSLKIERIVGLQDRFGGEFDPRYGWGQDLMNDMGLPTLNIVMKATYVYLPSIRKGAETVKLSDDVGKHTGSPEKVAQYLGIFAVR